MKTLLLCLLFVNSTWATPDVDWYEGSIVLANETVLTGMIAVDEHHHFVLYKHENGRADFYPAFLVREAFYYDLNEDLNRHFRALASRSGNFVTIKLYEVVVGGLIKVMRLAKNQPCVTKVPDRDNYEYLVQHESALLPLRELRGSLFTKLSETIPSLREFVKRERLSLYSYVVIYTIVQYVNRSRRAETLLSLN